MCSLIVRNLLIILINTKLHLNRRKESEGIATSWPFGYIEF